jgi:hypothetical protein
MHKFCNLSIKEIREFEPDHLTLFYFNGVDKEIMDLVEDKVLAETSGYPTWDKTPEKVKERVLSKTFPIPLRVRKVELLRRYSVTRAAIQSRNVVQSDYPIHDAVYNSCLEKYYLKPPGSLQLVKDFWEKIANEALQDPTLVSQDYRLQTIEKLDANVTEDSIKNLGPKGFCTQRSAILVNGCQYEQVVLINPRFQDASGNEVRGRTGFEDFLPIEIVGTQKTKSRKQQERNSFMKKNDLSQKSKKLFRGLKKRGISSEILGLVKSYLEGFLFLDMQEMAAHIVFTTCEVSAKRARGIILNEDDGFSDTSEVDSEEEDEGDEEPLPEVLSENEEN